MTVTLNRKNEQQVREFTHKAIKTAVHDALFCPLTLGEKHDIRVKPKFETACWSYLPPHRIYVGTGIVDKAKETLSSAQLTGYVKSHVRHELAHAHWTERNMRKIRLWLKEVDAPFQLFNLFEDARIEDRYRREADYLFGWLSFEDLTFTCSAESMLFGLIQAEGHLATVTVFLRDVDIEAHRQKQAVHLQQSIVACKNPLQLSLFLQMQAAKEMGPEVPVDIERANAQAMLVRVLPYYRRMIAAADTVGIFPVIADWMAEFGKPESAPSMGCKGEPGEKGDLEMGGELAEDPEAREAFEADTSEVILGEDGAAGKGKAPPPEPQGAIARKGNVLASSGSMPDLNRVNRLTQKLKTFFETEARTVSTMTPQRKVSARHFAVGRSYYRVKQMMGKARKKLLLEVDCSGSMSGFHIEEGKILVAALSRLAREGFIEGHVVLSAGSPSRWELYKFPMADDLIARIHGFAGAEGLEATLQAHMGLVKEADYVFVYTDAQICDSPINKPALHRYGVFTWGLYAGESEGYLEEMQKYFDKAIMRANAEALVDAMLIQKK